MSAQIPDPSGEGRGEDTTAHGKPLPPQPPLTSPQHQQAAAEGAYEHGLGGAHGSSDAHESASGDASRDSVPRSPLGSEQPQPPLTSPDFRQAAAEDAYQHGLGGAQPEGAHEAPRSGEQPDLGSTGAAAPVGAPGQPAPSQPAPGGYAPPAGGYVPPAGGYAPPPGAAPAAVGGGASTITLNYWLSVFFVWIPALIFYFTEKDKGDRLAYEYHRDNLNFSLVRTGVYVLTWILMPIDIIGLLLGSVLGLASLVLFVFHIIAAVKAPEGYQRGARPEFIFNVPLVK